MSGGAGGVSAVPPVLLGPGGDFRRGYTPEPSVLRREPRGARAPGYTLERKYGHFSAWETVARGLTRAEAYRRAESLASDGWRVAVVREDPEAPFPARVVFWCTCEGVKQAEVNLERLPRGGIPA